MREYIDTSIFVKWFRKEENGRDKSIIIKERILDGSSEYYVSKYGILELVRALKKNKFPDKEIRKAYSIIIDMYDLGLLKDVPMPDAIEKAKESQIFLNLYASDALHLASASISGCHNFWTEDQHFIKKQNSNYMRKIGIVVKTLDDIVGEEEND